MLVTGKNARAIATFKNKGGREKETLNDAAKNKANIDVVATSGWQAVFPNRHLNAATTTNIIYDKDARWLPGEKTKQQSPSNLGTKQATTGNTGPSLPWNGGWLPEE